MDEVLVDKIYVYSLQSKSWNPLEHIEFKGYFVETVMTSDQRNVIIVPAFDEHDSHSNSIYVLTMNDNDVYSLRKSNIVRPEHGSCHIAITGGIMDEILVIGYIKQLFKTKEFVHIQLPPFYIMQMIAGWYGIEMLHWMTYNDGRKEKKHFAISVKWIMASLQDIS